MTMFIKEFLETVFLALMYAATGYLILFFKGPFKIAPLNFRVIFLSFFTGLVSLVSLYSIFFTQGKTVQVILVPLVAYLAFEIRRHDHAFIKKEYSPYFPLAAVVFFIFILFGYSYLGNCNDYNNADNILYSKISYYMPKTGCENDYHLYNTLDRDYCDVTPYHYFDLWLNSVNCSILPFGSRYDIFLLVTRTILLLAIFLAFLAIYETHRKLDKFGFLLSFSILFFGGVFLPFYHKISIMQSFAYCFVPITSWHIVKFAPTVLFMVASYVVLMNLNLLAALLTLGMLSVACIMNLPGIGFAFVITFLFFRVFDKRLKLDFSFKHLCIALVPLVSVALFYVVLGNHRVVRGGVSGPEIIQQLHNFINPVFLKHFINIIASSAINIIVIYLLFIPGVILAFYKKQTQNVNSIFYFLIVLSFCIGGIISWGVLSAKCNAIQCFYFTLKPLPVLIFVSLLLMDRQWIKYSTICVICVFSVFNIYRVLNRNLKDNSKAISAKQYDFAIKHIDRLSLTASIRDSSDYNENTFNYYSTCFGLGHYVSLYNDSFFPISISDYNLPFEKSPYKRLIYIEGYRLGIFYRFVEKQKKSGSFVSIAESQIDFIKKYQIKNILLSPQASLPPSLFQLADSNIAIVPNSGERIVRLHY
jgi:hypothetical protein